jgi:hypothetical protein
VIIELLVNNKRQKFNEQKMPIAMNTTFNSFFSLRIAFNMVWGKAMLCFQFFCCNNYINNAYSFCLAEDV